MKWFVQGTERERCILRNVRKVVANLEILIRQTTGVSRKFDDGELKEPFDENPI